MRAMQSVLSSSNSCAHSNSLIVGLQFHPTTWVPTEDEATYLIIDEDKQGERKSRQPPVEPVKRRMDVSFPQSHVCLKLFPRMQVHIQVAFCSSTTTTTQCGYLLQWVHAKTLVHAWGVGKEGSQSGFKDETKVQHPVPERNDSISISGKKCLQWCLCLCCTLASTGYNESIQNFHMNIWISPN